MCREPAWGIPPMAKVMRKEAWQNTRAWSGFRSSPWNFLSIHPPKNKNLPAFPLFWHSLGKKVNSGLYSSAFERVFQSKNPSDGFLACLQDLYSCACDYLRPPDCRRHRKLKTSCECRGFQGVKIIRIGLIKGFICWANTCCQIFTSFICRYSWYIEKQVVDLVLATLDLWVKYFLCYNPLHLCSTGM